MNMFVLKEIADALSVLTVNILFHFECLLMSAHSGMLIRNSARITCFRSIVLPRLVSGAS